MPQAAARLAVQKTYKLFIGGKFVRGENGRVAAARNAAGKPIANYSRASRKDFRDAARAGRAALEGWSEPAGVMNILAGDRAELTSHFAIHMDVNASGDDKIAKEVQTGTAANVKRYCFRQVSNYFGSEAETPYWILDTTEMKTAWHPIGL